jgi:hypothetical protein
MESAGAACNRTLEVKGFVLAPVAMQDLVLWEIA